MTKPMTLRLTERVQVSGLMQEIDWPTGTVVQVVGERHGEQKGPGGVTMFTARTVTVSGPGGVRVTLPARLLKRVN